MKTYTAKILNAEDNSGDSILEFTPEFCKDQDWREGDAIVFSLKNGYISARNQSKEQRESKNRHLP